MLDVRRFALAPQHSLLMNFAWLTAHRSALVAVAGVLGTPLLAIVLVVFVAQPVRNEGTAMLRTFRDGDRLMINKMTRTYQRGDIVLFYSPRDLSKSYLKRVVAVAGDSVEIRSGVVIVGGTPLDEPYVDQELNRSPRDFGPETVPPDHVFVLGDNRDHSNDSRHWGMLPALLVYGRFWFRYA